MTRAMDLWRRLPAPARAAAHRAAQALSRATVPVWVRLAWRPGRRPRPGAPVTVAGLMRSSIGLGQGARLFVRALACGGTPVRVLDAGPAVMVRPDLEAPEGEEAPAGASGTVVTHLNPPELLRLLETSRGRVLAGARHVGYWAWELPVPPPAWRAAFAYVDEVWAPSAFAADALRRIAPAGRPVRVAPHPVWAQPTARADRAGLGLPPAACLTFVALDLRSTAARKNPQGALTAFRLACPSPRPDAALVCKISGARVEPELFDALQAQCADRPDILLLDRTLSDAQMRALTASADIVLSPHRAEGFGLLLAEAMRLGKAVVATGWSGNMDFMDPDCAALIDYRLAPVSDPQGMYANAEWAEPDLDHAARLLRGLIDDAGARAALGARAAARGGPVFDPRAWTALMRELLG